VNVGLEDAPFDTLRGSGSGALLNIRYRSRCQSSPEKTLKSAMMRLGVSKAEGGCNATFGNRYVVWGMLPSTRFAAQGAAHFRAFDAMKQKYSHPRCLSLSKAIC